MRKNKEISKPGLNQLGCNGINDINENLTWKQPLHAHIPSINERAQISTKKRGIKVTLPKLKFMEDV